MFSLLLLKQDVNRSDYTQTRQIYDALITIGMNNKTKSSQSAKDFEIFFLFMNIFKISFYDQILMVAYLCSL